MAQKDQNPNNFLRDEMSLKLIRQTATVVYQELLHELVWICILVQHNHIKWTSNQPITN